MLKQADPNVEKHLAYTHEMPTLDERKKTRRAAEVLVEAARRTSLPAGYSSGS